MAEEKLGFFKRLVAGLNKTRDNIVSGMDSIFHGFSKIDDDFYEELEETLIMGDLGVRATMDIIEDLKVKVKEQHIKEPIECRQLVIDSIREQMDVGETAYEFENRQSVVFVIGVNGVGKTTSIGKIANRMKNAGKKVILVAGDTFRAGATEQLVEWGKRIDVPVVTTSSKDPSAAVYDGIDTAIKGEYDVVLIDTAGRLQNKVNLMNELSKMNKVIKKVIPDAPHEVLLVVDATTGQNGIQQAKAFKEVTDVSGIILTKLDGSAKGGIVLAIKEEVDIPVKFVGLGEGTDDLEPFDIEKYIYGLFKDL